MSILKPQKMNLYEQKNIEILNIKENEDIDYCIFENERCNDIELWELKFEHSKFNNICMQNAKLENITFRDVIFENCDFSNTKFIETAFIRC